MHYEYRTYPLRILKQIITMFFSANSPRLRIEEPELESFVLGKTIKTLSRRYRFFAYYNVEGWHKRVGISLLTKLDPQFISSPSFTFVSEINFPPFGYVMTIDSDYSDQRLYEITYFSRYEYDEFANLYIKLSTLPTYTYLPLDYRSQKEVEEVRQRYSNTPGLQVKMEDVLKKIPK